MKKDSQQMKSKSTTGPASGKREVPQRSQAASSEKGRPKKDAELEKSPMKREHKGCC